MTRALLFGLLGWVLLLGGPASADPSLTAQIDAYLQSSRFSGAIIVTQKGSIVFDKAYGLADTGRGVPNLTTTSFHIGSLSRRYITASVLLRVDKQRLRLTNTVAQFDASVPGGDKITIGGLLGRTDPAAADLLVHILEVNSGTPLADVLDTDFFGPFFMTGSGLDDGSQGSERRMAKGYAASGDGTLVPSGPSPLGSAYTTTRDELRWTNALFGGRLLGADSLQTLTAGDQVLAQAAPLALGPTAYVMAGQGPGFSSVVVHQQAQDVTVVILSNCESASGTQAQMGARVAALAILDAGGELPPAGPP